MRRNAFLPAVTLGIVALFASPVVAQTSTLNEDFADVPTLTATGGWATINNSDMPLATAWFQGNPTVFPAQSGATNSYAGANFQFTTGTAATGLTINGWLLTPELNLNTPTRLTFFARTITASAFPDRMRVRLSTAGASMNVGTGSSGVGDFTTVLLDINPTLTTTGFPDAWTQFTLDLPSQGAAATGRIAFNYFVADGGLNGNNSNYIGVDTVTFQPVPEPTSMLAAATAGVLVIRRWGRRRTANEPWKC